MATPGVVNVDSLIQATEDFANRGGIDPTINMQNDKVYVFHGTADRTVYPGIGEKVVDYYTNYVKPENFLTEMTKTSGHGFPTDGYGVACDTTKSPFINDCGYNGAYEMLNYLYGGNLVRPFGAPGSTTLAGTFYEFDQTQFISGVASSSDLDTIAYAYIPSACVDSGSVCKLHVSLHGCLQGRCKDTFIRDSIIKTFTLQPTDGYGVACDTTKSPFINDCGYNGAYEMLNYLYGGNLVRPFGAPGTTTLAGTFYEFDQTQFISGLASSSDMDTIAYAYIPSACVDSGSVCKLHVSLHGCLQGRKWLDDEYAKMTGYNEVAELNNIIVIYPQATSNFLDSNPNGCWDWWGYLDSLFGTSEY
ncbi:hypothetical protein QYM36_017821, partial [Artemia franciscana]